MSGLWNCGQQTCQQMYLRALGNAGLSDTVPVILPFTETPAVPMLSVTAINALRRIHRQYINNEVRYILYLFVDISTDNWFVIEWKFFSRWQLKSISSHIFWVSGKECYVKNLPSNNCPVWQHSKICSIGVDSQKPTFSTCVKKYSLDCPGPNKCRILIVHCQMCYWHCLFWCVTQVLM